MKRVICIVLSLGMLVLLYTGVCAASSEYAPESVSQQKGGLYITEVPSIEEQLEGVPEDQREYVYWKITHGLDDYDLYGTIDESVSRSIDAEWENLEPFIGEKQETAYYCTPACCQAMLLYLTGTYYSQSDLADSLGTTSDGTSIYDARDYLNSVQWYRYVYRYAQNLDLFKSDMYYSIYQCGAPVLLGVAFQKGLHWSYSAVAHNVCVYGVTTDKENLNLFDPYMCWVEGNYASSSMYYNMSSGLTYDAVVERNVGYLY